MHMKWKRKIVIGLEALSKYVEKHPEATAPFDELVPKSASSLDQTESDSMRPNLPESEQYTKAGTSERPCVYTALHAKSQGLT
jgi:hypothetical protein